MLAKLKKALYGCIQSSRLWFKTMRDVLLEAGFAANDYDRCLFHKGHPCSQVNVCLYVDDLLVSSSVDNGDDELVAFLRKRCKEVKVRDSPENGYLGMRIVQNDTGIEIDMIPYVDECVGPDVKALHSTPADGELFNISDWEPLLDKAKDDFHTAVAKLLYVAKRARPDVLTAVSFLSSRVTTSTAEDMENRVLGNLKKTREMKMVFRKGNNVPDIRAYVDA